MKIVGEVTPEEARCIVGACPAMFETDRDSYVVIGRQVDPRELPLEIRPRASADEVFVEVPKTTLHKS